MLAGMLVADPLAVMFEHLFVERRDDIELYVERWRGLCRLPVERACDLSGQPRFALRSAAHHDGISAGGLKGAFGVIEGADIAIDDDWNLHRILHGPHGIPIGYPFVELTTGAAVHADKLDARSFGTA